MNPATPETITKQETKREKEIQNIKKKTKEIEIEAFVFKEVLDEGEVSSYISARVKEIETEEVREIGICYSFMINKIKNTVQIQEENKLSSLFNKTMAEPRLYDRNLLFGMPKDKKEEAKQIFAALSNDSILVLSEKHPYFIRDAQDLKIPSEYTFSHKTFSSPVLHVPKKDEATEREISEISRLAVNMAIAGIVSNPDIEKALLGGEIGYLPQAYIDLPEENDTLSYCIENAEELDIRLSEIKKLKQMKKGNPLFVDFSSEKNPETNKGVAFRKKSFFHETDFLNKEDMTNEMISHMSEERAKSSLLNIAQGNSDYYSKEAMTLRNSINRVSSSKKHGEEMSTGNCSNKGIYFWKFESEEDLVDAIEEENSPFAIAAIDNKPYLISIPTSSYYKDGTYSSHKRKETEDMVKELMGKARRGRGTIVSTDKRNTKLEQIESTLRFSFTNTEKSSVKELPTLLGDLLKKEEDLIPDIKVTNAIIAEVPTPEIMSHFTLLDSSLPVFPNIGNKKEKNVTFTALSRDTILFRKYLQLPSVGSVVKTIAKKKGIPCPDTKPFLCSLSDPTQHILEDKDKSTEINIKNPCGVFDLRHVPSLYSLKKGEDRELFLKFAIESIEGAFGEEVDLKKFEEDMIESL